MGDWAGRTVLVTGGTRGIGLAIGLAFGARGARVALTHRWGSADEDEIRGMFAERDAPPPTIVEADAADDEDLDRLLALLKSEWQSIDLLVSNVAVVQRGEGSYTERALRQSMQWTTWPLQRYFDGITRVFGAPRRVVAMSSDGHDNFYPGYDYVAASKAALEMLCAQLAAKHPQTQCNVVRARQVQTTSFKEIFGDQARSLMAPFEQFDLTSEEVADAVVALCSGSLDALSGQVLVLDRGATFQDNLVGVGPTLLGLQTRTFEPREYHPVANVHWVGADAPHNQWPEVDFVEASQPADAVVVAIDWATASDADATLLPRTMQTFHERGEHPRYAVQIDINGGDSPLCAASRALGRYFDAWRVAEDLRVNFVAIEDMGQMPDALGAVRALVSGSLDIVRGQVLQLRGAS